MVADRGRPGSFPVVAGGAAAAYVYIENGHKKAAADSKAEASGGEGEDDSKAPAGTMRVEVTHPKPGGLDRRLSQVCSVHAFEHAQLYAKISGFLQVQNVDIGDRVKKDQLLAEIYVPEVLEAVKQAAASLDQAKANIKVADAKIRSAASLKRASQATVRQTQAEVATKTARREYPGQAARADQGPRGAQRRRGEAPGRGRRTNMTRPSPTRRRRRRAS